MILSALHTLGFRGEALASIASIARVLMSSKTEDGEHGLKISADGGQINAAEPVAHGRGTTVEVRELFFTVPGRRKFLGSEATESRHIRSLLDRLALSRFDVAFSFGNNGAQTYRRQPTMDDPLRRIEDVLGADFVANAIGIDEQSMNLRISGWLTQPTFARTRGDQQHLFVNGRSVRDRLLMAAVSRGYSDTLHGANRHPPYALYLEIDPSAVDVNVPPGQARSAFFATAGESRASSSRRSEPPWPGPQAPKPDLSPTSPPKSGWAWSRQHQNQGVAVPLSTSRVRLTAPAVKPPGGRALNCAPRIRAVQENPTATTCARWLATAAREP